MYLLNDWEVARWLTNVPYPYTYDDLEDYLLISKDGSFEYQVDTIKTYGDWILMDKSLVFNYHDGRERNFVIDSISSDYLVLEEFIENRVNKFYFKNDFTTSINSFSRKMDQSFKPIVDKMTNVIFWDISSIYIPFNNMDSLCIIL